MFQLPVPKASERGQSAVFSHEQAETMFPVLDVEDAKHKVRTQGSYMASRSTKSTPLPLLSRAACAAKPLTVEREGKAQGKCQERKKVNGKEGGMRAAHTFQPVDFNPSRSR